ncbi:MAG: carbon starvation protein A [Pirellulaceae bacterium]|nr:carbon starvation protein A [Pirellulaceae bacterium]
MNAMPLMLGVLATLAIAYRYYSAFLAAYVVAFDDTRVTPAHTFNDGQNYDPTNKWVLFGHHFAAISGAGPLIGPVLAIQFGYMPGLIWLVIGVCLAGAVQDMLVLWASVRTGGKSLAEIARSCLGPVAGTAASISILFIVIIALSGLGIIVVKALGGEEVKLPAYTQIVANESIVYSQVGENQLAKIPAGSKVLYPNGSEYVRSEGFSVKYKTPAEDVPSVDSKLTLPLGTVEQIKGSSWGTFTIFCTIPIALAVGWYTYRIRKGRVIEASLLGAVAVLAATVAGNWIPGSFLEPYFLLTRDETIFAICFYGFVASVLPVWLLLVPRDYLSSFLKIGTIAILVLGVLIANPRLEAPAINTYFAGGGGPYFPGPIFPFVFICIMCGAISGFHALVASGTTPKMVSKESDIRMIGYGAMLMEGLVAVTALMAAATLPQGDYWAINIDITKLDQYAETLAKMDANVDHLADIEKQVGGETLRGRTGGAVTLAVGMAHVMTQAVQRVTGGVSMDGIVKYWYHFAIMFEALFILTTIDTGTRIARFLVQEIMGRIYQPFGVVDWLPGVLISSFLVSIAWGGLIWSGSIDTIWPMFGIANQLLAGIALSVVTTLLVQNGKRRYIWVTILPMLFVLTTTLTASAQMIWTKFSVDAYDGWMKGDVAMCTRGSLCTAAILFLIASFLIIVVRAITEWVQPQRQAR